jgi:hypothetical protein
MSESEEDLGNGPDVGDLDLLSAPLDNGDGLTAALTRRPRAKLPSLTLVLVGIVVASAGFIGGIAVGKHYGSASSRGSASAIGGFPGGASGGFPAGASGGFPAGASGPAGGGAPSSATGQGAPSGGLGNPGGGLAGGNATVGTIELIDGSTVYVKTSAGATVQVSTSKGTKVTVSSTAPVKDLKPGVTVIVEGSKNSSGGVTATSISQTSAG